LGFLFEEWDSCSSAWCSSSTASNRDAAPLCDRAGERDGVGEGEGEGEEKEGEGEGGSPGDGRRNVEKGLGEGRKSTNIGELGT
jgi:hypothetical protein